MGIAAQTKPPATVTGKCSPGSSFKATTVAWEPLAVTKKSSLWAGTHALSFTAWKT